MDLDNARIASDAHFSEQVSRYSALCAEHERTREGALAEVDRLQSQLGQVQVQLTVRLSSSR